MMEEAGFVAAGGAGEMSRAELAADYFLKGYNCGQAVVLAFADRYGLSVEEAARIAGAFGGGIGRQRLTCGAVLGLSVLAGFEEGAVDPADKAAQKRCYETVRGLCEGFKEQYGSTLCAEILGLPGYVKSEGPAQHLPVPEAFRARPCALKVQIAAALFDRYLRDKSTAAAGAAGPGPGAAGPGDGLVPATVSAAERGDGLVPDAVSTAGRVLGPGAHPDVPPPPPDLTA